MNAKLVDSLVQIIQTLTDAERKELDTKLSVPANKSSNITDRSRSVGSGKLTRFQQWDSLSDADVTALKAEFAQKDIIFAETILPEYSSNLQQEDYA
jgi:predicted transcriptional regulator